MSREDQSAAYLAEAELTLRSARLILDSAAPDDQLWAQVVKNGYDAIEQAVSAAIAYRGERVPRRHPAKIDAFLSAYDPPAALEDRLLHWLRRRSDAQYVDIRGDDINVPHAVFDKADATEILTDADTTLEYVRKALENG